MGWIKAAVIVVGLFLPAMNSFAVELEDSELNFKVTIPRGFKEYDKSKAHSDAGTRQYVRSISLYSYNKGGHPEKDQYTGIFLDIERSFKTMTVWNPDIFVGEEVLKEKWKEYAVNVYRQTKTYTTLGDKMVILIAVVPLVPEPLQFKISGDVKDEEEMRAILITLLANLEGEGNYLKSPKFIRGVLLVILAAFLLFGITKVFRGNKTE